MGLRLPTLVVAACQAASLCLTFWSAVWQAFWSLPVALLSCCLRALLPGCDGSCDGWARFYEVSPRFLQGALRQ